MRRPTSYLPRLAATAAVVAAALLASAPAARADIVFSIAAPSSVAAGSTNNTLEIWLTSTTGSSTVVVDGFSFGITSSQPGVTFTSATTGTTLKPYIFGSDSLLGPVIDDGPGTTISGGDVSSASGTSVTAGTTFGLALVTFDVSSGSSGSIDFSFVTAPQKNTLSTPPPAAAITIARFDGATTTITNTTAVPEPSVMALAGVVLAAAAGRGLWRRRKAA
ncbi:MAG: PEP-CTERM sorting domain-containing protein [Isosphaeraceae bacterium]